MPTNNEPTRDFTLSLRESLLAQVKNNLCSGVHPPRDFSDEDAMEFLRKNPDILGSIVHFDEVDTTDRERIWERLARASNRPSKG